MKSDGLVAGHKRRVDGHCNQGIRDLRDDSILALGFDQLDKFSSIVGKLW